MSTLPTDQTMAAAEQPDEVEPEEHRVLLPVVVLFVTAAVWAVLFVARVQAHQGNVDDYGYANIARDILQSSNPAATLLHTGSTSPLVPALAAPGASVGGVYGAMTVELPFLLILVAGSYFLARLWISPLVAMVTALAVALNEDVSSYAVMLHFAVPTAAALVWAFYSYIRSWHLRDWKWSLIFGVSIAVMLLSRSMSIVYVVPLVVVAGIDLIVDISRNGNGLRLPALGAVATTLVLAGPWWLVSGSTAIHYLHNAGYQPSSGYTSQGVALNATTIKQRATWTLSELGWGESWVLAIALLASLWVVVRHHRTLKLGALWMLAVWVVLTSLILSSSSNSGTAFGLPVLVILILLAAIVLGQMSWRILPVLGVVLAGVLTLGLVSEATGSGSWWPVAPYRGDVVVSGGTFRTNADLLTAQAARLIGSSPTLVAQDTDILNSNGIIWYAGWDRPPTLLVPPSSPNSTKVAVQELARARFVITGSGSGSYNPLVNQGSVESSALRQGFHVIRLWLLGNGSYSALWQRGNTARSVSVPSPITWVVGPSHESDVKGKLVLAAGATDRAFAVMRVQFIVSGTKQKISVPAYLFDYAWIGVIDTTTLPNGTYTVESRAVNTIGGVGRSKPVTIYVNN